ncbi:MAG: 23S rRNA (adenine(2503)-C(2))-methyltransferase RlmN [Ruminococcaceae bacterium]|nr:23S rRNA (adenine(2503)-C(2))-methyltransferase RlmN [Oscillospiraceae bacterium]
MMNIKSMTLPEMTEAMKELGQPAFRAKQVYTWLHKGVRTYDEMQNIPKDLRAVLAVKYPILTPRVVRRQESKKDGTIKYLWQLSDGNCIETVLMRYHYGNTVCISTEVGCRMGCAFCASTLGGLVRRLEPFEMLDEVLFTQVESGLPISHIVLMGIGEPLDNYESVLRFLELVNSPDGMNISMRHISLSTCGLVPKIDALANEKLQITLSVSLHAPSDEIRDKIMPVNKAYPTDVLLDACRRYYAQTNRRISFEYAMIDGVNDTEACAMLLLKKLKGLPAHMNLIPLNHVEESPLKPSSRSAVMKFQKILEDGGVPATVRRTLGGDIDASCGQLRRKYTKEKQNESGGES